jgi:hypothetical protein
MYPEGTLVQVIGNTNNHWFEVGEVISVGGFHPNKGLYPDHFRGEFVENKTREERNKIGSGPWVKLAEVIPAQSLEQLLKECLE